MENPVARQHDHEERLSHSTVEPKNYSPSDFYYSKQVPVYMDQNYTQDPFNLPLNPGQSQREYKTYLSKERYVKPSMASEITKTYVQVPKTSGKYYYRAKETTYYTGTTKSRPRPTITKTPPTVAPHDEIKESMPYTKPGNARPYSERSPVETIKYYRPKKQNVPKTSLSSVDITQIAKACVESEVPVTKDSQHTERLEIAYHKGLTNQKLKRGETKVHDAAATTGMPGIFEDSCSWGWFVDLDDLFCHPCVTSRH